MAGLWVFHMGSWQVPVHAVLIKKYQKGLQRLVWTRDPVHSYCSRSLILKLPIFLNSQLALFPAHKILGGDGREPENRTISEHHSFTQSFGT